MDAVVALAATAARVDDERRSDYWPAVRELHRRDAGSVVAAMLPLRGSTSAHERALTGDVLAQVGTDGDSPYEAEIANALLGLLRDHVGEVRRAAAMGFRHHYHAEAVPVLLAMATSVEAEDRFNALFGLSNHLVERPSATIRESVLRALLVLSSDESRKVRDWAVFELAAQDELTLEALGPALWRRVTDDDAEIRSQAMNALAARVDEGILPYVLAQLLDEIERDDFWITTIRAIECLPDERFVGTLESARKQLSASGNTDFVQAIDAALAACRRTIAET
jgi:hypothetical protein